MIDSALQLLRDGVWLRPLWLLTLLPLPWVIWRLSRQPTGAGRW